MEKKQTYLDEEIIPVMGHHGWPSPYDRTSQKKDQLVMGLVPSEKRGRGYFPATIHKDDMTWHATVHRRKTGNVYRVVPAWRQGYKTHCQNYAGMKKDFEAYFAPLFRLGENTIYEIIDKQWDIPDQQSRCLVIELTNLRYPEERLIARFYDAKDICFLMLEPVAKEAVPA